MRRAATGLRKSRRRPVPPSMASRSKPPHRATLRSPHGRGLQQLRAEQDRPRHERFRDGPVLVHEGHRRPRRCGFDGPLEGRERVEAAVAAFQHDRAPAVAPLRQVRANPAPSDRRRRHIPRRRDGARQAATAPRRGGALPDAPDRLPALDRRRRLRRGPGAGDRRRGEGPGLRRPRCGRSAPAPSPWPEPGDPDDPRRGARRGRLSAPGAAVCGGAPWPHPQRSDS